MPIIGVIASSAKGAPAAPIIGTATNIGTGRAYNNGAATVTFTPGAGATATSFTATSSPGGFTATGASSPLTVQGLQSGVSYTFTVTATNAAGTSPASAASNSITATTVPQAPTIGTATKVSGSSVSLTFTAGATGGTAITSYTATSSPSISLTTTGTSSPVTVNGSYAFNQAYTFTLVATNANGSSTSSGSSNSVTPNGAPTTAGWVGATIYPSSAYNVYMSGAYTSTRAAFSGGTTSLSGGAHSPWVYHWTGSWSAQFSSAINGYSLAVGSDGTTAQYMGAKTNGGWDNGSQFTTDWQTFTNATNMPISLGENAGIGWLGTNTFTSAGGSRSGSNTNAVYYRTGSGAWTTGTVIPLTSYKWRGTYANGRGYATLDLSNYYQTAPSSGWTSDGTYFNTDAPASAIGYGNFIFALNGGGDYKLYYFWAGSWTVLINSAHPAGNVQGSTMAMYNNELHNVGGIISGTQTRQHYYAVIN